MRYVPAIGPSGAVADRKTSIQRSINLYLNEVESPGEDKVATLESAPGYASYLTMPGTIRGSYNADGRWFVVAGTTLYEIVSGAAVSRGTVLTGDFVSMRHGQAQLVLAMGSIGYVFQLNTNTLLQITDADYLGSDWVETMDGYFIFATPGTDQFQISAIDDASTIDALDFSSADIAPDLIVTHRVMKRELYIFGTTSTEIWINSGDATFPFARYNATPIDVGAVGLRSVARAADSLVWVGQTDKGKGYVYLMEGHQPRRISTRAVEEALATSTDLTECKVWGYQTSGHEFVGISAPGMETDWVWDAASRNWHERGKLAGVSWAPLGLDHYTVVDGQLYACAAAEIYRVSRDYRTAGSSPLIRERTWPHLVSPSLDDVSYRQLEVACTTGTGGNITLEVSNDGGAVYGAPLLRSLGATGRRMQRVRWHMLGSARDRVFRLRCADDVDLTIHEATLDAG
jgi:hypothetical protein